jgi:class 3 adenylate cyclase
MVTCAACGRENPDGFRFCGSCGRPLTRDVAATREVRKMITVVFCDLAGSTALGERLDPESLQRVLGQYFERMREVLERHQGTVEKFIGDAVVGVFGVPGCTRTTPCGRCGPQSSWRRRWLSSTRSWSATGA